MEKRWIGKVTRVRLPGGRKERVLALTWEAFAEAVSRPPYCLDPQEALRALAAAGRIAPGRRGLERDVRLNGKVERCVCIPMRFLDL